VVKTIGSINTQKITGVMDIITQLAILIIALMLGSKLANYLDK